MKQRNQTRLYNIMLPLWLLLLWPSPLWLVLIPVNYLLDRIVLRWSLGDMPDKGLFCRNHTWKICLAGFVSDLAGIAILFAVTFLSGMAYGGNKAGEFLENLEYGVGFNPFSSIPAFLIVVIAIAVSGLCIYLIDKAILTKAGLDDGLAKSAALKLAIITAPYLYLFPSDLMYANGF